jgi:hypothetical protein
MRSTAVVAGVFLLFACTAIAQDEIFSDDFETGLPYEWNGLTSWMPSVEIEADFEGLTSQYVKPEDGATITAVGSDGTEYTLTIPPDALMKPAVIIMIPIAAIPNLPLTDGLGAGVELLPDGLTFFKPATLEITPASGTVPDTAVAFAFKESGTGFHLYPHLEESGTVTIPITEFSGYGYGSGGDLSVFSSATGTAEISYMNTINAALTAIVQDESAGFDPDPNDVAKIREALEDWHKNVVEKAISDATDCAASCCPSMVAQLGEAANRQLKWEATVELLDSVADFSSYLQTQFERWGSFSQSFCDKVDGCDVACAAAASTCDSLDQINDLIELQKAFDLYPSSWGFSCVYTMDGICQGLNGYILGGVEMQCADVVPEGGTTGVVAVPRSLSGKDLTSSHLSNPAGGSPIEWMSFDPSIASLVGASDGLAVTVKGIEEGVTQVGVRLTQCEQTVVGACTVEVGDPLRVRIGACDWNSTSCHLPSLAGGSTTVDVEALFDGAEPTDEIQIAVQPYRPLGEIDIEPAASSCTQFPGNWSGLGCAGTAAPGERFTVAPYGLEPEFPVFAVHVTAEFEGVVREAVAWAYSTDICYSDATFSYDWDTGEFSEATATGTAWDYVPVDYYVAPDRVDVEVKDVSASATCGSVTAVLALGGWWDTVLVVPKDLRQFDQLLDTSGTLETPISGAAYATTGGLAAGGASVDGYTETWDWDLIPNDDWRRLSYSSDGYDDVETETDRIVYLHFFGKPFRLIGRGFLQCFAGSTDPYRWGYAHVDASAAWDVVTAMTWEEDYLSLHEFRIFSCSGEFDLNWPP